MEEVLQYVNASVCLDGDWSSAAAASHVGNALHVTEGLVRKEIASSSRGKEVRMCFWPSASSLPLSLRRANKEETTRGGAMRATAALLARSVWKGEPTDSGLKTRR